MPLQKTLKNSRDYTVNADLAGLYPPGQKRQTMFLGEDHARSLTDVLIQVALRARSNCCRPTCNGKVVLADFLDKLSNSEP